MDFDSEDREDGKLVEAEECGKEEGNELLKDIFGVSDGEEGEDFEGFTEEDCKASQRKRDKRGDHEGEREDVGENGEGGESHHGSDHDGEILDDGEQGDKVWDFDVMMEKRRAEMKKRRKRRKDVDFINDSDDMIEDMMKTMREAAEKDRELNKQKKPAIAMMQNLKYVKYQLKKVDLHQAFLDSGILTSIAEWLAPLPNHALPHHEIREALLKQLTEFPAISTEGLKMSGLGKAVMFLLKHPKELPQNKQICRKLINDWARPFFNQNADYKALSKEEREQRDYERLTKRRKLSESEGSSKNSNDPDKVLRPGDPGYVYRARVPAPSIKDYVIRPKWNVEDKPREGPQKKKPNKLAKLQRAFMDQKKAVSSAVKISIEGRNMKL